MTPLTENTNFTLESQLVGSGSAFTTWRTQMQNIVTYCKNSKIDIGTLFAAVNALQVVQQSTLNIDLVLIAGTSVEITINQVNAGNLVIALTDQSGSTTVILPDATSVTEGSLIRFYMVGNNILELKNSVSGQKLDGNSIDTAQKIRRPSSSSMTGWIVPLQSVGIYSWGGNWHTITNM